MDDLLSKIRELSTDEIELILKDQKDLYTEEEFKLIHLEYEKRFELFNFEYEKHKFDKIKRAKEELNKDVNINIPEEINCLKCDGIISSSDAVCKFCGYKNNLEIIRQNLLKNILEKDNEIECIKKIKKPSHSLIIFSVILFIIGIISIIITSVLKDDDKYRLSKGVSSLADTFGTYSQEITDYKNYVTAIDVFYILGIAFIITSIFLLILSISINNLNKKSGS